MAALMFPAWRHRLEQAQAALGAGNLDAAVAQLEAAGAAACGAEARLVAELAEQLARRALERAAEGALAAALEDLSAARRLGGCTPLWQQLAGAVVEATLHRALQGWLGGQPHAPREALTICEQAPGLELRLTALREATRRLEAAWHLRRKGKYLEARRQLAAVQTLAPHEAALQDAIGQCRQQAEALHPLLQSLQAALKAQDPPAIRAAAAAVLALAPEHPLALAAARQRGPVVPSSAGEEHGLQDTAVWVARSGRSPPGPADESPLPEKSFPCPSTPPSQVRCGTTALPLPSRLMLWVDGVGSYLVLLADQVVIGQALAGSALDLPIQADLSRRHARIVRTREGYLIEPLRGRVELGGRQLREPVPLTDGDEFVLGSNVHLRFRQPHPLSYSARLELLSGHRTAPPSGGVLLVAQSCVLGPQWRDHVVCDESSAPVLLARSEEGLKCQAPGIVEINGRLCEGGGVLPLPAYVVAGGISFYLERA